MRGSTNETYSYKNNNNNNANGMHEFKLVQPHSFSSCFVYSLLSLSRPPPPHRWCDSFVCLLVSVALWLEQQTTFPIITRRTPPVHTVRYIHALWHPANGVWRIVVSPSQKLAVWLLHAATANCYMLERYLINSHKNLIMRLFRNNPSIIAF